MRSGTDMIAKTNSPVRRTHTRMGMYVRRAAVCGLMIVASAASAQQMHRDYYHAQDTHDDSQTLRNTEQFHVQPAIDRMKGHNYPGALQDLEFILDVFPNHPTALAMLSDLCDVQWKSPQCDADPRFLAAIARNPTAAPTFLIYGLHLQRRNQLPAAVEAYKKSISLNPGSANAHYNLALVYFDQKQFELANQEAQISYAQGIPLPGLQDKLTRAKVWKPLDPDQLKRLMEPPPAPAPPAAAAAPAAAPAAAAASTTTAPAPPVSPPATAPVPAK
jgi:predicted Zn-dependent protease